MSTVVNVRGACGAGKSTLVRSVMDAARHEWRRAAVYEYGRRKPIGYLFHEADLFVPGHYEIQNGGLDTIGDLDAAYAKITEYVHKRRNVLFEGMNQKSDLKNVQLLNDRCTLHVVFLDLTLEECVASFRAKGQKRDVKYVEQTWRKARREQYEFAALFNIHVVPDRAEALSLVKRLLEIE